MEVILLEDVANLGAVGDLVSVKPGYGRNFLLPRKLAVTASTNSKRFLAHQQRVVSFKVLKAKAESAALAKKVAGMVVTLARKVGDQKMFGSVTSHDIAQALNEQGLKVDRKKVVLAEPIKQVGEYKIQLKLRPDVHTDIIVKVVAEGA